MEVQEVGQLFVVCFISNITQMLNPYNPEPTRAVAELRVGLLVNTAVRLRQLAVPTRRSGLHTNIRARPSLNLSYSRARAHYIF